MRGLFDAGSAYLHGRYMIEMSFKHPIMYMLWYRWWVPSLLHEDERKHLRHWMDRSRKCDYRPYWAEFSMHHPIQFIVGLFLWRIFQGLIKLTSFRLRQSVDFSNGHQKIRKTNMKETEPYVTQLDIANNQQDVRTPEAKLPTGEKMEKQDVMSEYTQRDIAKLKSACEEYALAMDVVLMAAELYESAQLHYVKCHYEITVCQCREMAIGLDAYQRTGDSTILDRYRQSLHAVNELKKQINEQHEKLRKIVYV
jgi:hypothetical protein